MTPARKRPPASPRSYQLKLTLEGVRPPVWRRYTVRDDITLLKLHDLLQIIMGWTDSHLHQFVVRGRRFNHPDLDLPPPREDEGKVQLRDVLKKPTDRMVYEYDFGDGWAHALVLERVLPHELRARYPVILDGRRACPPEDCGGAFGYGHLLDVLAAPDHPEHEELREWAGEKFDSERFDVGELNRVFHGGWHLPGEDELQAPGRASRSRQTTLRLGAPARR
jgi:hypothetical protein